MPTTARPHVVLISLGGTIASVRTVGAGARPTLTPTALLNSIPQVDQIARVTSVPHRQVVSSALTIADLLEVITDANDAITHGATGVVVTTGTDTLDEAAFALDLLWSHDAPLVITGAMRSADSPGADGPANLLAAVAVAASDHTRGLGALVVLNDEIHAARHVQKSHTTNPAAFTSPLTGPLGQLQEGHVAVFTRPIGRAQPPTVDPANIPPVALIRCGLGDDGRTLSTLLDLGYQGAVIETTGGGAVPPAWMKPLAQLAGAVPTVYASRVPTGAVLQNTYDDPGCDKDLLAHGLIPAGNLDGLKSRILLTLLISSSSTRPQTHAAFANPFPL